MYLCSSGVYKSEVFLSSKHCKAKKVPFFCLFYCVLMSESNYCVFSMCAR